MSNLSGDSKQQNSSYEWQVALSFAGEDREYAARLKEILKNKGIKVFYDEDEQSNLWGKDLYQELQSIYRDKALYCIVLISKNYVEKRWTQHELKQMQAKAFEENREYILPLRLDDTSVPGINNTTGYIDLRSTMLAKVADLVEEKLSKLANVIRQEISTPSQATNDIAGKQTRRNRVLSEYWHVNLLEVLRDRLNEEDLKDICYDLLRYDSILEELISLRKRALSRDLLVYLESRHRLDDLVNYLKQNRPDIIF